MKARLFARFGPEDGLEVEFGAEATIGRGKENSVLLSSREVSQRHARVFFDAETAAYWVEDLGSLNGTQVDGEPLADRQRLGGLHVLSFGESAELFFVELDLEAEEPQGEEAAAGEPDSGAVEATGSRTRVDAEAPTLPPGLEAPAAREGTRVDRDVPTLPAGLQAKEVEPGSATRVDETPAELPASLTDEGGAATGFVLEILGGRGGRFELQEGDNLVGRSDRANIALTNRELSRRHATLRVEGDRVWLRDEDSRNHTFVGDEQITEEVELEPGSELRFGRLEARLTRTTDDEAPESA